MSPNPYSVRIATGDGLIARFGDVTVYLADPATPAERLLAAIESLGDTVDPGAVLPERLAPLTFGDSPGVGAFGAVAPTAEGLLVLLRGRVAADIETTDGRRELTGERAMTWVDELLSPAVHRIMVRRSDVPATAEHQQTDLRGGVVPGGGFVLYPVTAPPTRSDQASSTTMVAAAVAVEEPTAQFGAAPLTRPLGETSSLQAVGAALMSDDGAVYPLDRSYVIGRDPLGDEAVRNASATPLPVHGDPHISRIHAYVSVDDRGAVSVRDASTPGGTFVAAPGDREWTEVKTPFELPPGWSLRVGERIFTHRA